MRGILLLVMAALLAACSLASEPADSPPPPETATPESAWERLADGMEWRTIVPEGDELAQLVVVRVEPERFRFRALYTPGEALPLSQWKSRAEGAALIVNANFFDENNHILGGLISDGATHGDFDQGIGGRFAARGNEVAVEPNPWLSQEPLGDFDTLVQGYPLLIKRGYPTFSRAEGERTRRTIIAQDSQGLILILVAPYLGLPLGQLAEFLSRADLNIRTAVNLDGGGSTMISLPAARYSQASFQAVPAALALFPR